METVIAEPATKTTVTEGTVSFSDCVHHFLQTYLTQLEGKIPDNLYPLVLVEMEVPLLKTVMQFTNGNQSRAAKVLGLSRGTLRKKLALYEID